LGIGSWLLGALLSACAPLPLTETHSSTESLARAVLDAVERRDSRALQTLALTEQEFRDHVWPELPAARPERNLPFSYVWGDLRQKSDQGLAASIAKYGGRPLELVRIAYEGESTRYGSSLVHRDTVLVVHRRDGVDERVRLYGSTLEKDGAFKVFSYVVDE
jgi:hypothetical protein